jgi:hypothetical protein
MMLAGLLLLSAAAAVHETACDPNGPVIERVGSYENWRNTEEHQYGYGLQLWKQGEELFGLLRVAEGHLAGDIPIGVLEDIEFNSATGAFSFRSRLSLGMISATEYSRDVYVFSGTMRAARVDGSIERQHASGRASLGSSEVALERDTSGDATRGPASCADWTNLWEPVFAAWGPK